MKPVHTLEEYQDLLDQNPLVLTYITGTNCGVCSSVKPKIREILADFPDITALEINAHQDRELAAQLSVFTIPAVLVSVQGREHIREARYFSLEELRRRIDRLVALFSSAASPQPATSYPEGTPATPEIPTR
ncbi:thioredoxin family protein [Spirochaeta lutea]|uniref:thioredoxin family protein n=1 Tax=Spirochaeta lutea TaxID=1480694 RepID=UPI0012E04145|nr:thioredoxin family protein [Spirochaeta lutea]